MENMKEEILKKLKKKSDLNVEDDKAEQAEAQLNQSKDTDFAKQIEGFISALNDEQIDLNFAIELHSKSLFYSKS